MATARTVGILSTRQYFKQPYKVVQTFGRYKGNDKVISTLNRYSSKDRVLLIFPRDDKGLGKTEITETLKEYENLVLDLPEEENSTWYGVIHETSIERVHETEESILGKLIASKAGDLVQKSNAPRDGVVLHGGVVLQEDSDVHPNGKPESGTESISDDEAKDLGANDDDDDMEVDGTESSLDDEAEEEEEEESDDDDDEDKKATFYHIFEQNQRQLQQKEEKDGRPKALYFLVKNGVVNKTSVKLNHGKIAEKKDVIEWAINGGCRWDTFPDDYIELKPKNFNRNAFCELVRQLREVCKVSLTAVQLDALDDVFAKLVKEEKVLDKIINMINNENVECLNAKKDALVEKFRGNNENLEVVRDKLEKAFGVDIFLPGDVKEESEKLDKINALLGLKFDDPSAKECEIMSKEYRKAFDKKGAQIRLNPNPVTAHFIRETNSARSEAAQQLLGNFVFGEKAKDDIVKQLNEGSIVVVAKEVAFATYPVGDDNPDKKEWNALTGLDCAEFKMLHSQIICAHDDGLQRYWKNLRTMFATIARHKLDIIRKCFQDSKCNDASFYTIHVDATSFIAPGGQNGEALIQKCAKKDLQRNTELVLQTLAKHGFDVHVHSTWLFNDYVKKGDDRKFEFDDNSDSEGSLCRHGTLSFKNVKLENVELKVTVSAHKSMWFYHGSHKLMFDCIRSALKGGGDNDEFDEFADAGARNSVHFILPELTKKFSDTVADKLKADRNNNNGKPTINPELLGTKAFVAYLFNTWTNPNAWPKTLDAIREFYFHGTSKDVDCKSLLNELNKGVNDKTKRDKFSKQLEEYQIKKSYERPILQARERHYHPVIGVPGFTVAKIINAVTLGACGNLFEKQGNIGNTRESKAGDFFVIYWSINYLWPEEKKKNKGKKKTSKRKGPSSHEFTPACQSIARLFASEDAASLLTSKCCCLCDNMTSSKWYKNTDTGKTDICNTCYQKHRRAVKMAPPNGCALCDRKESSSWYKNTDTGETDICEACYHKQRAVEMAPPNGCALCERKESSKWHKNTDTGERDICEACYQKHRHALKMAPPNGCALCERKESSKWYKNTDTGEIDICEACYNKRRRAMNSKTRT